MIADEPVASLDPTSADGVMDLIKSVCAQDGLTTVVSLHQLDLARRQKFKEMMPPDFSRWREWLHPLLDTFFMSIAGTAIAVFLGLPLGLCAARTTNAQPLVYAVARSFLNLLRAIPELIMGIFLVAAVGFGALPGALALGLHSLGMVATFFAGSFEHADPRPIEAAQANGAPPMQVAV